MTGITDLPITQGGNPTLLPPGVSIKLSAKDKNLVSLWWLLEIVMSAIVGMNDEHIPPRKRNMYKALADLLAPAKADVQEINDMFSEQINKTFGIRYQNTLADTCIAIVTLLETMVPEQVTKVIMSAGITKKQMVDNWFKEDQDEKHRMV